MPGIALNQTTLSSASKRSNTRLYVASTTNIFAPVSNQFQQLYVVGPGMARGEMMRVTGVPSAGVVDVERLGEYKADWPSGSVVLIGIPPTGTGIAGTGVYYPSFQVTDPQGSTQNNVAGNPLPTTTAPGVQVQPWINVLTGDQWIWSTVVGAWVPGFNNACQTRQPTALVASAAGLITPSGPLFHVSGTAAVTGFTIPVGFVGGRISIIPDAVFTWTAANNIALAGTAVVSKLLDFVYDAASGLFYPSYIA